MGKITHKATLHDVGEDVIVKKLMEIWKKVRDNQNLVTAVIVAAVVIWIAVILFGRYRNQVITDANYNLVIAQNFFMESLSAQDDAAKKSALANCEEKLSTVAKRFAGEPIGQRALFMSGVFQFRQLNFTVAGEKFAQFKKQASNNEDRARGALAEGAAYENESFMKNDNALLEKALASYEEAERLAGPTYVKDQAMMARAQILARKADTRAKAIALLETVIKDRQQVVESIAPKKPKEKEPAKSNLQELELLDGPSMVKEAQNTLDRLKGTL